MGRSGGAKGERAVTATPFEVTASASEPELVASLACTPGKRKHA